MEVSTQYIGHSSYGIPVMDEVQRIAYLKHMGYEQYYSRYVLAGAKASVIPATQEDAHDLGGHQQLPAKTREPDPPRREHDGKPTMESTNPNIQGSQGSQGLKTVVFHWF